MDDNSGDIDFFGIDDISVFTQIKEFIVDFFQRFVLGENGLLRSFFNTNYHTTNFSLNIIVIVIQSESS